MGISQRCLHWQPLLFSENLFVALGNLRTEEMDKFRLPKSVDFHLPSALVGSLSKHRNIYSIIKVDIDKHLRGPLDLKNLMKVVDDIDKTKGLGFIESMRILGNLMEYLRIKLLSKDFTTIEMTAILLDVLVKNCQYRIHIFVGRKNFMKTYCYVMRQLLGDHRHPHQRAGKPRYFDRTSEKFHIFDI